MEITEVRVKLMEEPGERLKAFCSITFDNCFVIRDLKIIEGTNGPFVAMPSRKLTIHCPGCRCKNHLRAAYCNQCGGRLREPHPMKDDDGRAKLYADIAHPINSQCREMIQLRVLAAFEEERSRSQMPGYVSSYVDFDGGDDLLDMPVERVVDGAHATPAPRHIAMPASQPVAVSAALPGNSRGERPQGPHRPPARRVAEQPKGDFGAGIFE